MRFASGQQNADQAPLSITASAIFSGTVPNNASGLSVQVTATDISGLSASETFSVLTAAAAQPIVTQTPTQTWRQGQTVSFCLAANTFVDPQQESLTYKATLSNGSPLPSWLKFNAVTLTFTGVVPRGATGLSVKVTATDTGGASASETFPVLTPAAAAPILTAQTSTQTWQRSQPFALTLATNTFTDPQQEALTYKATLSNGSPLPTWLKFNAATRTFTGVAPAGANGLRLR